MSNATENEQHSYINPTPRIFRLALLFEGGLAIIACLAGILMEVPPWRRIEWRWEGVVEGIVAAVPMMLSLLVLRRMRQGPLARLNKVVDQTLVPLFARCSLWQLAVISGIAGLGEELLFRGVMQPLLIGWLEIIAGIVITSIVFGLLHALTITYAVLAFIVSAYLGWLAVTSGNLLGPILAHALYDFFALVYLIFNQPNSTEQKS